VVQAEGGEFEENHSMNPYMTLGSGCGTPDGLGLAARLAEWHDAMVAHERHLRSMRASTRCDDDCPHDVATSLWSEALDVFGSRAHELQYLRDKALSASRRGGRR
jgi:hypothetical protein